MQIFIDDQESATEPQPGATVEDILQSVRSENAKTDRAILSVACDGIDLADRNVDEILESPAVDYSRIEVQTGDPGTMIADALADALDTLETTTDKQAKVIALFAAGKTGQAMNLLADCISHWHEINTAITQSLALLNTLASASQEEPGKLADALQPVQAKLIDVRDAIAQKDYVSLADILEYEFADISNCWRDAINAIQNKTGQPKQPPGS